MPIYEYGEQGDVAYLVMPYVKGGTLRSMLEQRGKLDADLALCLLRHEHPRVREHGVRLGERWLASSEAVQKRVLELAKDPDARLRLPKRFVVFIERSMGRPNLQPADVAAVERSLALLEERDADSVAVLRRQLELRLSRRETLFDLRAPAHDPLGVTTTSYPAKAWVKLRTTGTASST